VLELRRMRAMEPLRQHLQRGAIRIAAHLGPPAPARAGDATRGVRAAGRGWAEARRSRGRSARGRGGHGGEGPRLTAAPRWASAGGGPHAAAAG